MGLLIGVGNTIPQFPYQDLWYGIKINLKNSGHSIDDGKLERVGNLDLHRSLPIQKHIKRYMATLDGKVNYWLGTNDSTLKEGGGAARLNALDGNVMLYKPDYYRRVEFDGDYMLVAISEVELPGFIYMGEKVRSPWFGTFDRTTNKPVSASFLQWNADGTVKRDANGLLVFTENAANFRGGNNSATNDTNNKSLLGMPVTSTSKATIRERCKTLGEMWHHGGWRFREEMSWLMAIEFGDLDSQAMYNAAKTVDGFAQGGLGNGTYVDSAQWSAFNGYYPIIPSGITAKLGNNTGIVDYVIKEWQTGVDKTLKVASYRGWEAPQQSLWEHDDDIIIRYFKPSNGGQMLIYLCTNPSKFATPTDNATVVPDGYEEMGALPQKEGYITSVGCGLDYTFPSDTTGGASNKNYCDYFWRQVVTDDNNLDGWYQLLSCVGALYSESAGVRGAIAHNRGAYTYTNYGFPLCLEL